MFIKDGEFIMGGDDNVHNCGLPERRFADKCRYPVIYWVKYLNQKFCAVGLLGIAHKVFECGIEMQEINRCDWELLDFVWRNNKIVESQPIFQFVILPKNLYIWVYLIQIFYLKYIGFPFLFIITNSIIICFNQLFSSIFGMFEINFDFLKFIKMIKIVNLFSSMDSMELRSLLKKR